MATSTGFTLTINRSRVEKGVQEVWGSLALAAGDYATNGLTLPLNSSEIRSRSLPLQIVIEGKNGWEYRYVDGTSLADGKVIIRGQQPTDATAGQIPLSEFANATALPASMTGDVVKLYSAFKFND
ncbi:MAG: hypothetical protein L0338_39695 [Acidobacteria bacterium]|nr:hypothetical protein [Acidobacteriota bacterium]